MTIDTPRIEVTAMGEPKQRGRPEGRPRV